jgi:hypothetical protein
MSIELPATVEKELQDLAVMQRRDIHVLEAVRLYLEAAAITDLTVEEVGETQLALAGELRGVPEWKDGHA